MLRPTVLGLACHVGVPECVNEVVAVFKKWITDPTSVPKPHPDLRSIVYSYGTYVKAVFCYLLLSADSVTLFHQWMPCYLLQGVKLLQCSTPR